MGYVSIAIAAIFVLVCVVGVIYAFLYGNRKPEGEDNDGCGKIFIRFVLIIVALAIGAFIWSLLSYPKGWLD